ncbi:hypothetical protein SS50377_24167 [Spironucleus salmonicida]|uniref:Uncharacterized protein n=1 Tax=Spironucleus salmonicida TaxID=348837 RepID=V6LIW7_9EUKA|nr:hypothetical protein SS50377_24167 [Spironucleus salmonicida]|eukprot:EST44268.1 Hypothetical protein SS50377_15931 [Spironucleus salmonicida]
MEIHFTAEEINLAQQQFQILTKNSLQLHLTPQQAKQFMLTVDLSMDTMKSVFTKFFKAQAQFTILDFAKMLRLLAAQQNFPILNLTEEQISVQVFSLQTFPLVRLKTMSTIPSASLMNLQTQQTDNQFWDQSNPLPPKQHNLATSKSSPTSILLPIQENQLGEQELESASKQQMAINYLLQELQDNDPGLSFIVSRQQATNLKKQLTELAKSTQQGFESLHSQLVTPPSVNFDQIQNLTKASCGQISDQILSVTDKITAYVKSIQGLTGSIEFEELRKLSQSVQVAKTAITAAVENEAQLAKLEGVYTQIKQGNQFLAEFLAENEEKLDEIHGHSEVLKKRNGKLAVEQQDLRVRLQGLVAANFDFGLEIGYNLAVSDIVRAMSEKPLHSDEFWGDVVDKSESGTHKMEGLELLSENCEDRQ